MHTIFYISVYCTLGNISLLSLYILPLLLNDHFLMFHKICYSTSVSSSLREEKHHIHPWTLLTWGSQSLVDSCLHSVMWGNTSHFQTDALPQKQVHIAVQNEWLMPKLGHFLYIFVCSVCLKWQILLSHLFLIEF